MDAPGHGSIRVASLYLKCGEPLQGISALLLKETADILATWSGAFLVGGDFNCSPAAFAKSNAPDILKSGVIAPDGMRGTCTGKKGKSRVIDYFCMSKCLAVALQSISVTMFAGTSPHRPVVAKFPPRLKSLQIRKILKAPRLPTQRIFDPLWEVDDWERNTTIANIALAAARSLSKDVALLLADEAFQSFADQATQEILAATLRD